MDEADIQRVTEKFDVDPVCLVHGKKMSEHKCLYCCLCFEPLTEDQCNVLPDGSLEDVCKDCALMEKKMKIRNKIKWWLLQLITNICPKCGSQTIGNLYSMEICDNCGWYKCTKYNSGNKKIDWDNVAIGLICGIYLTAFFWIGMALYYCHKYDLWRVKIR